MEEDFKIAFGKHKGKLMSEVPAKYLIYIQSELKKERDSGKVLNNHKKKIVAYIDKNWQMIVDSAFLNSRDS